MQYHNITPFDPVFLDQLNTLPPVEWQTDAYSLFIRNEWQPWFYPYQVVIEKQLAGFGLLFQFEKVAWLGWILVHTNFRNKGIGTSITEHLINEAKRKGAESLILTATEMGFPIYHKFGFRTVSYYRFFRFSEKFVPAPAATEIRRARLNDLHDLASLDRKATGENRILLLENNLTEIYVHANSHKINGFIMPGLGNGYIVADDEHSGMDLFNFRCHLNKKLVAVPEQNIKMISWLSDNGFSEINPIPRMVLGKEPDWNPKMIFHRGTGYSG